MTTDTITEITFADLNLPKPIMQALTDAGYEKPSPIQALTIPHLLNGKDLLGQAQTGTGKTAAFALPILTKIDTQSSTTQALILCPTRELAMQVSAAFSKYGSYLPRLEVACIYGGQDYRAQLRSLKKGAHIVVGTPGRVMDHMRRATLDLKGLNTLVLDEADEMLQMGFIDDIEWVLEQTPDACQMALFSATMPKEIQKIANKYLTDPERIAITTKGDGASVTTIQQHLVMVEGNRKMEALTRVLEVQPFDGAIIFVRTKAAAFEVSEYLNKQGFSSSPLNGDMQQNQRELTITNLKKGKLDILVATDVAARGLDVERITHVINYDIPFDPQTYIHRIGRTGRAGRSGDAILLMTFREKGMLRQIERVTNQQIMPMVLPSSDAIKKTRFLKFKDTLQTILTNENLAEFMSIVEECKKHHEVSETHIAAAMLKMMDALQPLRFNDSYKAPELERRERSNDRAPRDSGSRDFRGAREGRGGDRGERGAPRRFREEGGQGGRRNKELDADKVRYRIEVGHTHGVKPGNIVGAIANEANLDSAHIGCINIFDDFSTVDLPKSLTKANISTLHKIWVCGQKLSISETNGEASAAAAPRAPYKAASEGRSFDRADKPRTFDRTDPKKFGARKNVASARKNVFRKEI